MVLYSVLRKEKCMKLAERTIFYVLSEDKRMRSCKLLYYFDNYINQLKLI